MKKKIDEKPVTEEQAPVEEIKPDPSAEKKDKIEQLKNDVLDQEQQVEKKTSKYMRKKQEEKEQLQHIQGLTALFAPTIANVTNIVFVRLNWKPLDANEEKSLTDATMALGMKYLPYLFAHFAEELNFAFVVSCIFLCRVQFPVKKESEGAPEEQ